MSRYLLYNVVLHLYDGRWWTLFGQFFADLFQAQFYSNFHELDFESDFEPALKEFSVV